MAIQSRFMRELGYHIKASFPWLLIVTDEQDRLHDEVEALAQSYLNKEIKGGDKFQVFRWTCTDHWTAKGKTVPKAQAADEVQTVRDDFEYIKELPAFSIAIMENFHFYLTRENPDLIQRVKDFSRHCQEENKTVIFANSGADFPPELEPHLTVLDHELPLTDDIVKVMDDISESVKKKNLDIKLSEEQRFSVVEALKGMRLTDIENHLAYSVVKTKTFDHKVLMAGKCQAVKKVGMLEFVQSTEQMDQIGGLEKLKAWLKMWKIAFSDKAKKYGIRTPRGILPVGVPGCGKSMVAKATANEYGLPLIRFDMSAIFSKYVGESEQNIRKGLKVVDAMAPCVLWIDELEKGMSGASSSTDGGTSPRVFGKWLEWLNDHTSPVFVVATSNNIDAIPVEFTRKGRFDEIFFVDIPTSVERKDIFRVQFTRQKLESDKFDIVKLVDASKNFTGAEVSYAIEMAKLMAANRGEHAKTEDILEAISQVVPEAKKNKSRIDHIRQRASEIAVPASFSEEEAVKEVQAGGAKYRSIQT